MASWAIKSAVIGAPILCTFATVGPTAGSSPICTKEADLELFASLQTRSQIEARTDGQTKSQNRHGKELTEADSSKISYFAQSLKVGQGKLDSMWPYYSGGRFQMLHDIATRDNHQYDHGSLAVANQGYVQNKSFPPPTRGNSATPSHSNSFLQFREDLVDWYSAQTKKIHPIGILGLTICLLLAVTLFVIRAFFVEWVYEIKPKPLLDNDKESGHQVLDEMLSQFKKLLQQHQLARDYYRAWYLFYAVPSFIFSACIPFAKVMTPEGTKSWASHFFVILLGSLSTILAGVSDLEQNKALMQRHDRVVIRLFQLVSGWHHEVDYEVRFANKDAKDAYEEFQPKMIMLMSKMLDVPEHIREKYDRALDECEYEISAASVIVKKHRGNKEPQGLATEDEQENHMSRSLQQHTAHDGHTKGLKRMQQQLRLLLEQHQKARFYYKKWYLAYAIPSFVIGASVPLVEACGNQDSIVLLLSIISTVLIGISNLEENKSSMEEHHAAIGDLGELISHFKIEIDTPVRLHLKTAGDAYEEFKPKMMRVSNLLHVPSFISEEYAKASTEGKVTG